MKQKVIIVLALFYSIQMIVSCCPMETFEHVIRGATSRTLVLEENRFTEISGQDPINKEDLILEVLLQGDRLNISSLMHEFKKLGPQSAYAAIDCEEPTIVFRNRLDRVEIFAVDINNAEVDITGDLVMQGSDQSINEYVSENLLSIFDGFLVEFNNVDNLPAVASFKIQLFLDDGGVIEIETNAINFN